MLCLASQWCSSVVGISANIQTIANSAATTNINTVAADLNSSNNIGAVAGAITNVNNVGGSITNVNTVANNVTSVNAFGNTYKISPTAPTGRTVAPHKDTEVPGGFEHTIFGPQASVFVRCHAAPPFMTCYQLILTLFENF